MHFHYRVVEDIGFALLIQYTVYSVVLGENFNDLLSRALHPDVYVTGLAAAGIRIDLREPSPLKDTPTESEALQNALQLHDPLLVSLVQFLYL